MNPEVNLANGRRHTTAVIASNNSNFLCARIKSEIGPAISVAFFEDCYSSETNSSGHWFSPSRPDYFHLLPLLSVRDCPICEYFDWFVCAEARAKKMKEDEAQRLGGFAAEMARIKKQKKKQEGGSVEVTISFV